MHCVRRARGSPAALPRTARRMTAARAVARTTTAATLHRLPQAQRIGRASPKRLVRPPWTRLLRRGQPRAAAAATNALAADLTAASWAWLTSEEERVVQRAGSARSARSVACYVTVHSGPT
eukprot:1387773-Prymnesium_polylepis.1